MKSSSSISMDSFEEAVEIRHKSKYKSHQINMAQFALFEKDKEEEAKTHIVGYNHNTFNSPNRDFIIKKKRYIGTPRAYVPRSYNQSPCLESLLPKAEIQKLNDMAQNLFRT